MVSARGGASFTGEFAGFAIEVEGEELVNRRLSRFGDRIVDLTPAWEEMVQELYKIFEEQFESEGSRTEAWAPLADSTLKKKSPGLPILVDSGDLKASVIGPGKGNSVTIEPQEFTFGTDIPYGVFHQSPAARSSTLPRRPFMALTQDDRRALMRILQRYLAEAAKEA